jgi:hypothetical protein
MTKGLELNSAMDGLAELFGLDSARFDVTDDSGGADRVPK